MTETSTIRYVGAHRNGVHLPGGHAPWGEDVVVGRAVAATLLTTGVWAPAHDDVAADDGYPEDRGGGWYQLSNGDRIQGRDAAFAAQAALDHDPHGHNDPAAGPAGYDPEE